MAQAIGGVDYLFQSTPPVRGATNDPDHAPNLWVFQSTPPVRGATSDGRELGEEIPISIHAPRAGGDKNVFPGPVWCKWVFQSTPPVRGATPSAVSFRRR